MEPDKLELALLNRIFLSEVWFRYARGATLGELVEAFIHVRDSYAKAKGHLNYTLQRMSDQGIVTLETREAPEGSPNKTWRTTHEGRIRWLLTPESVLTSVNDSFTISVNGGESNEPRHPDPESS